MNAVKCKYHSVWDDGIEIITNAEYHPETGLIESVESIDVDGLDLCKQEFIVIPADDGDEVALLVCRNCHEGVIKAYMEDDNVGHGIHEVHRCRVCGEEE